MLSKSKVAASGIPMPPHLQPLDYDSDDEDIESYCLFGRVFYVMDGDKQQKNAPPQLTREELQRAILRNGGKIDQNPSDTTTCIIVGTAASRFRVDPLCRGPEGGKWVICTPAYVLEAIERREPPVYSHENIIYMPSKMQEAEENEAADVMDNRPSYSSTKQNCVPREKCRRIMEAIRYLMGLLGFRSVFHVPEPEQGTREAWCFVQMKEKGPGAFYVEITARALNQETTHNAIQMVHWAFVLLGVRQKQPTNTDNGQEINEERRRAVIEMLQPFCSANSAYLSLQGTGGVNGNLEQQQGEEIKQTVLVDTHAKPSVEMPLIAAKDLHTDAPRKGQRKPLFKRRKRY